MVSALLWDPGPECPSLRESDVHVWATSLDRFIDSTGIMNNVLSSEERVRAGRFHFARDRERYIAGVPFRFSLAVFIRAFLPGSFLLAIGQTLGVRPCATGGYIGG